MNPPEKPMRKVKPVREACCKYCGAPFSPFAAAKPCAKQDNGRHYFAIEAR